MPGDARDPADILASPELTSVIDTSKPFCVILSMILNFVAPEQAAPIMATFRDAMPDGSFLALTIGINDDAPDLARDYIKAYSPAALVHLHSREQIAGYFTGMQIVEPGLIEARHWRPPQPAETAHRPADALAGLGRKAGPDGEADGLVA